MTFPPKRDLEGFMKRSRTRDLEQAVRTVAQAGPVSAEIKVSVYDLSTRKTYGVRADESGWAASTIKVPVLATVAKEVDEGRLDLFDELAVNHRFSLEPYDTVTQMDDGAPITVARLAQLMISASDNEATNILADKVGVEAVNERMWSLGMSRSMLGHLLCPKVPRYTSDFNPDGSNITCPQDMQVLFRHIYDPSFSSMPERQRRMCDFFLSLTRAEYLSNGPYMLSTIKAKVGLIRDPDDGADIHETGIIDDRLIVSVMLNKIKLKPSVTIEQRLAAAKRSVHGSTLSNVAELLSGEYWEQDSGVRAARDHAARLEQGSAALESKGVATIYESVMEAVADCTGYHPDRKYKH